MRVSVCVCTCLRVRTDVRHSQRDEYDGEDNTKRKVLFGLKNKEEEEEEEDESRIQSNNT